MSETRNIFIVGLDPFNVEKLAMGIGSSHLSCPSLVSTTNGCVDRCAFRACRPARRGCNACRRSSSRLTMRTGRGQTLTGSPSSKDEPRAQRQKSTARPRLRPIRRSCVTKAQLYSATNENRSFRVNDVPSTPRNTMIDSVTLPKSPRVRVSSGRRP